VWIVVLDSGRRVGLDKEVIRHFGVVEGKCFTPLEWRNIKGISARKVAKDSALDYLGRRARSEKELRQRLRILRIKKGLIDEVISDLKRTGLLDDRRFAMEFAEDFAARKAVGAVKMRAELQYRGIDKEIIEDTLGNIYEVLDSNELIRRSLKKKSRLLEKINDPKVKQKLYQYLLRQGFTWDEIKESFHSIGKEIE